MKAEEILKTAAELVSGDRHEQHGEVSEQFQCIADLWNLYLKHRYADKIVLISKNRVKTDDDVVFKAPLSVVFALTPEDIGILQALIKLSRICYGSFNIDNFIDFAGYIALAGQLASQSETQYEKN